MHRDEIAAKIASEIASRRKILLGIKIGSDDRLNKKMDVVASAWVGTDPPEAMRVAVWEFPRADFCAWKTIVGETELADWEAYISLLDQVEAEQNQMGRAVVRVRRSAAEMMAALEGKENTADVRARIIAEWAHA